MRPYIFVILTVFLGIYACGSNDSSAAATQSAGTPQKNPTTDNFAQRFPQAQDIEWDTLDDGMVASFTNNNESCEAFYDTKNAFVYAGTFVDQEQLPAAANAYLTKNYKADFVNACMKVDFTDKKAYNVEVMTDTDYVNLQFDLNGNLIQQSKEPLTDEEMQAREEEGVDESK